MIYKDYIVSEEWYNLKIDIVQQRGCNCERCGIEKKPNQLHLHHLSYERLFNEQLYDLQLLCPKCHMNAHGLLKPKKIKKTKEIKIKKSTKKSLKRARIIDGVYYI